MNQPWNPTVIAQWVLEGPNPEDGLYGVIDRHAVQFLLGTGNDTDTDRAAWKAVKRMVKFYEHKLKKQFQENYPGAADQLQTFSVERLREAKAHLTHMQDVMGAFDAVQVQNGFPPAMLIPGANVTGALAIGISDYYDIIKPRPPFPINGVPTSTTLAGQADNGDFVADVTDNLTFINMGTLNAPNWVQWDTHMLINWLWNPDVLLECGYQRAIYYLRDYATDMDDGEWANRLKNMPTAAQIKLKQVIEEEDMAFSILRVDESGDGILTDYEREMDETYSYSA